MPDSTNQTVQTGRNRRKGPRPKHVPMRTCVVCRETDAKRGLTRIVRTAEDAAEIDVTGKRNGRGAYICSKAACWEKATSTPLLSRALRASLSETTLKHIANDAKDLELYTSEPVVAHSEEPTL